MTAGEKIVFPARAGMNRVWSHHPQVPGRVPRESGDEPLDGSADTLVDMCSPRERG